MPIRFRCAYCNQLMGIARRKANTVVNCPRCSGQVIVPTPETDDKPNPPRKLQQSANPPAPAKNVFEESNIDDLLEMPRVQKQYGDDLPMADVIPQTPAAEIESLQPPYHSGHGIYLSPLKLTIASVVIALLLGLAFFLGTLFGGE